MKHYIITYYKNKAIISDPTNEYPKLGTRVVMLYKEDISKNIFIPVIGIVTEEIPNGFPFRIGVDGSSYSINRYIGEFIKEISIEEFEKIIK